MFPPLIFPAGCASVVHSSLDLQKRELGPHAYEERMPVWLHDLLESQDQENTERAPAIMTLISILSQKDPEVKTTYLCHDAVRYIGKIKNEDNNFCGYRNLQMLVQYLKAAKAQGYEKFGDEFLSVFKLQDMIEEAWNKGFNEYGQIQTGGVKDTRKHIGTAEAQAIFRSLGIACRADAFHDEKGPPSRNAYEQLLDSVEQYFSSSTKHHPLPPIYLQRPRHSMTIIGMEIRKNGSRNLLVFDPAYNASDDIVHYGAAPADIKRLNSLLKPYRRGEHQLKRYSAFETLRLTEAAAPAE
ncbi:hypothetical protein MMC28_010839 [Mycoblastus sanguinarius]|nr:hypothetical protein [Mycoblastus sanguinarius]